MKKELIQRLSTMMASFTHTLAFCLSKLRSSLEYGKSMLRVWLQYARRVTEELLFSTLGASFVLLKCSFCDSEMVWNGFEEYLE